MTARKWYQGLTHDIQGKFSPKQTVISASIIATLGAIGWLSSKQQEKGKWQQKEEARRTQTLSSRELN